MLTTWPLYYVNTLQGTVGELNSKYPEVVIKRWMNAPPLNEADALLVRQQLIKLGRELNSKCRYRRLRRPASAVRRRHT